MITIIAKFESRALLRSAPTWLIGAALMLLCGLLFLQALESYLAIQPKLALQDHPPGLIGYVAVRYLSVISIVLALTAPLFAMKSYSDDFRQHTLALWQSSPVSSTAIALGKFAGVYFVLAMLVLIACAIPLSMRVFTPVDTGVLMSSTLGLLLAAAAFTSVGLFFSSLTKHALMAVAGSVLLLLLLWLMGSALPGGAPTQMLAGFSIATHLSGFFQGYLALNDVLYFLILTIVFIALTIVRLDSLRHNGV